MIQASHCESEKGIWGGPRATSNVGNIVREHRSRAVFAVYSCCKALTSKIRFTNWKGRSPWRTTPSVPPTAETCPLAKHPVRAKPTNQQLHAHTGSYCRICMKPGAGWNCSTKDKVYGEHDPTGSIEAEHLGLE
jgi:hypothetical protein